MFHSLNPFLLWHSYQYRKRWEDANLQFIAAYKNQNGQLIINTSSLLIDIARQSGNKKLMLDSFISLINCYSQFRLSNLTRDRKARILELINSLEQELTLYPHEVLAEDEAKAKMHKRVVLVEEETDKILHEARMDNLAKAAQKVLADSEVFCLLTNKTYANKEEWRTVIEPMIDNINQLVE